MVSNILGMFASDYTIHRILENYPGLTQADIVAALQYAAQMIDEEKSLSSLSMSGMVHVLCDENIPWETVKWLASRCPYMQISHIGHFLAGATDREVFEWAHQHQAIIVTYDSDFSDLRSFPLGRHFGIVRLRVWPTNVENTNEALNRFLQAISRQEASGGALVIVDAGKVRVRYPTGP